MESAHVPAYAPAARERNMLLVDGLLVVLLGFATYTAVVVADYGPVGFVKAIVDNTAAIQVLCDLTFSASIALWFIREDARKRDLPFWPYFVGTLGLGSIALMAYLLHRAWRGNYGPAAVR